MKKILIGSFVLALLMGSTTVMAERYDRGDRDHRNNVHKVDRDKQPKHKKFLTSRYEEGGGHRYRGDREHHRGKGHGWKGKHGKHHRGHGHGWKKRHAWKHKKHHRHHGHGDRYHSRHYHRHHRHHDRGQVHYRFSYNSGLHQNPAGFFSIDLSR